MTVRVNRTKACEALAETFGWDLDEMADYAYQPTRWMKPNIFTIGDDYFAAHKSKPKHWADDGVWVEHSDQFGGKRHNLVVWKFQPAP